jgi:signal transduction histidine kinase
MVGALLDFTRSRLGGIPVTLEEMDIGRAVRNLVNEIQSAHPQCNIEIESQGELRGSWDQDRISQALSNVISNAVQHGAEDTTVTVSMKGDKENVEIAVHNLGVVISPEQRDGIFNPMHNRPGSREAWGKGPTGSLGLGLYIAERIVTAHGGHIEIESTEADGTTFTVQLPRSGVATPAGE